MAIKWNVPDWLSFSVPANEPLAQAIGICLVIVSGLMGCWFVNKVENW